MENNLSSFVSFNCKSLLRSLDYVKTLCRRSDVIALQETWLFPHDLPILGSIDDNFGSTGKSAIDTSAGVVRGRPYGGVALLWRKSAFSSVSVIACNSDRLTAIRAEVSDRSFLIFSVYMPTDSTDNLPEFTDCLSEISAVVDNSEVTSVFILGDFNANPNSLFGRELVKFCVDQKWICADFDKLGSTSDTFTFISEAHGSTSWLDHCIVTGSAWQSIVDIKVHYDCVWSDHLPLEVKCNVSLIKPLARVQNISRNKILWGERDSEQTNNYQRLSHEKLRLLDFPAELANCCDNMCNNLNHRRILDNMYELLY